MCRQGLSTSRLLGKRLADSRPLTASLLAPIFKLVKCKLTIISHHFLNSIFRVSSSFRLRTIYWTIGQFTFCPSSTQRARVSLEKRRNQDGPLLFPSPHLLAPKGLGTPSRNKHRGLSSPSSSPIPTLGPGLQVLLLFFFFKSLQVEKINRKRSFSLSQRLDVFFFLFLFFTLLKRKKRWIRRRGR